MTGPAKLKIKSRPEDFIVDEVADIPLGQSGGYGVYRLEKRGWNTAELCHKIARDLTRPTRDVAYGGKKDRHALTSQIVTIKSPRVDDIREENFSLAFRGYSDRPMGPDRISANRFEITVRQLSEERLRLAIAESDRVKSFGYPNYFDDQRFGSLDPVHGFIAEKILLGHFNGALKIFLTSVYPEDKKPARERKIFFSEHWRDWKTCLTRAATEFEKEVFELLAKHPNEFLFVLKQISRERMSLYMSAYQSYLWNELVRRLIVKDGLPDLRSSTGKAGDYVFYGELTVLQKRYWHSLTLPTASGKTRMPDEASREVYVEILRERGVRPALFNKLKLRDAFFKSTDRPAVVRPENLELTPALDELSSGKWKLVLKFLLPRGCYGTMLLKRLFCSDRPLCK